MNRTMTFEVKLPSWANWIAQDKNGTWFAFSHKPNPNVRCNEWDMPGQHFPNLDHRAELLCDSPKPKDWTQELYQIYYK